MDVYCRYTYLSLCNWIYKLNYNRGDTTFYQLRSCLPLMSISSEFCIVTYNIGMHPHHGK